MASDWAARAVLRLRRLRASSRKAVNGRLPAPSLAQLSHLVALALGVLLVVPALGTRPAVAPAATTHSTGDVLWSSPVR
ncbi:MAG TPA: hypothetical protein VGD57_00870, partial [Candidatus Dormibacteraeota bacterium]